MMGPRFLTWTANLRHGSPNIDMGPMSLPVKPEATSQQNQAGICGLGRGHYKCICHPHWKAWTASRHSPCCPSGPRLQQTQPPQHQGHEPRRKSLALKSEPQRGAGDRLCTEMTHSRRRL